MLTFALLLVQLTGHLATLPLQLLHALQIANYLQSIGIFDKFLFKFQYLFACFSDHN